MKARKITIQVDISSRELPYLSILKTILERDGIDVEILPQDPIWHAGWTNFFRVASKRTDLLVTPSYNSKRTLNTLAWKYLSGAKLVHFHSEQLIDERFYEEKLNTKCTKLYDRDVDFHLVWGDEFASLLVREGNVDPGKVYVAGCPKFDLIDLETKKQVGNNPKKKVLFVCDFLLATMTEAEYLRTLRTYGYSEGERFREFYFSAYSKFLVVVSDFASRNPDVDVVVRPHPGEPEKAYEDLVAISNVSLDIGTPFVDAASSSNLIVQFLSTSYFESIYLNKPVICLDIVDDWMGHYRDYFKYYNFVSVEHFDSIVKESMSAPVTVDDKYACLEQLFSVSGGSAVIRVAAALKHMLEREAKPASIKSRLIDYMRVAGFVLQHFLKNCVGLCSYVLFNAGLKNKFTKKVIEAEERWRTSADYFDELTLAQFQQRYNNVGFVKSCCPAFHTRGDGVNVVLVPDSKLGS